MDKTLGSSSESLLDIETTDRSFSITRSRHIDPAEEEEYYDMSGEKILIILNQRKFKRTKHFQWRQPSRRKGTNEDRDALEKLFKELGFKVTVLHNKYHSKIIETLNEIASQDHTKTSCICVAILTHGDTGGQICAKDRKYSLSEVMNIFVNVPSLVGKPKMYFVQGGDWEQMLPENVRDVSDGNVAMGMQDACRGGKRDAGQTMHLGIKSNRFDTLTSKMPGSRDSLEMNDDSTDRFDSESNSVLTVPTGADQLVLYACLEGYASYRSGSGSWLIQSLCKQIRNHHNKQDILGIITRVNREVSKKSTTNQLEEKNNKKQIPETILKLTKTLML